jgi:hypothetical protein
MTSTISIPHRQSFWTFERLADAALTAVALAGS